MKKHLLGAFLLGLTVAGTLGTATAFADDTTPAATPDNTPAAAADSTKATTNGDISFGAGTLSLKNVTASASLLDQKGLSVSDVYLNGVNASAPLTATVEDFLGNDGTWTLMLSQDGWQASSANLDKTAQILKNTGTLSIASDEGSKAKASDIPADGTATEYATGSDVITELPSRLTFNLPKQTNVQTGKYTNTLNWSLNDSASATQE
ncbi:hypothetical protein [Secundilactobacillus mixtipabuli]|uniref:WxL domain-containing protein n=1 Tax=Secundilactobacillus mixtipabuli TaxID=1435342 RepID=A0A1Z5IBF2_9LACO|nr:hypothetical protein [Secundilactobacillus mixtipabuli]GAW99093.1 hypothetical protein IWT30_01053 [Secundilactobacillus mixtipabuli]